MQIQINLFLFFSKMQFLLKYQIEYNQKYKTQINLWSNLDRSII